MKRRIGVLIFVAFICGLAVYADSGVVVRDYVIIPGLTIDFSNSGMVITENTGAQSNSTGVSSGSSTSGDAALEFWIASNSPTHSGSTSTTSSGVMVAPRDPQDEFREALAWLYTKGITKYDTVDGYRPYDYLTRQEASKMMTRLYQTIGFTGALQSSGCQFDDILSAVEELRGPILDSCQLGLFFGYQGNFFPIQKLTKPQLTAVLIRMLEQKRSAEYFNPRWLLYFEKASILGVTKETSLAAYDISLTRFQTALLIYRFAQIAQNGRLTQTTQQSLSQIDQKYQSLQSTLSDTGMIPLSSGSAMVSLVLQNTNVLQDPQLAEALFWLRKNNMINTLDVAAFRPFDALTREEGAYFLAKYYLISRAQTGMNLNKECGFSDMNNINSAYRSSVNMLCELGVVNGQQKTFRPKDPLLKSDLVVLLMRMMFGTMSEATTPRRQNYFLKAQDLGLLQPTDAAILDKPLSRYEMAILLYTLTIKQKLLSSLNSSRVGTQLISLLSGTEITDGLGQRQAQVVFNNLLLFGQSSDSLVAQLFDTNYIISKKTTQHFIADQNGIRYGDLKTIDGEQIVGSVSFLISNGQVLESTIRLFASQSLYFSLTPNPINPSVYFLLEQKLP